MHGILRLSVRVLLEPFGKKSLRVGQRDLLVYGVERVEIIRHEITSLRPYFSIRKGGVKEEGEEMSEEQKKKIDGVLHEMKHMNPQQIEVMITYMQGMATAAKLMQAERKEA